MLSVRGFGIMLHRLLGDGLSKPANMFGGVLELTMITSLDYTPCYNTYMYSTHVPTLGPRLIMLGAICSYHHV